MRIYFWSSETDENHYDHSKQEGKTHRDEEGNFVFTFCVRIRSIQERFVSKYLWCKFIKEYRKYKACKYTYDRSSPGSTFPEHTEDEHRKYARADKAGVFLNECKS